MLTLRRHDDAIQCYQILLRQPATASEATEALGYLYYVKRQPQKALEYWTSFLDNHPDSLPVLTMTAWLLATDPNDAVRNGSKAVALAERAAKICQGAGFTGLGGVGGRVRRKRRFYAGHANHRAGEPAAG